VARKLESVSRERPQDFEMRGKGEDDQRADGGKRRYKVFWGKSIQWERVIKNS